MFCLSLIIFNVIEYGILLTVIPIDGIQAIGFVTFYTIAIGAACKFIRLAQRWKDFIHFISKQETPFTRYPYKQNRHMSLKTRIRILSFSLLALAGVEHGLSIISNIFTIKMKIEKCNSTGLISSDFGRAFIDETKGFWLALWSYHPIQIPIFEFGNYAMTYCWNFIDVMVIVTSIMVTYRFDQIYERVSSTKGNGMATFMYPQQFWKEIRMHYGNVQRILMKVNEEISLLTVMSLMNNIYFICLQFYNSFL